MPFDAESRMVLTGLTEGLLPLQEWITSADHKYLPPNKDKLPWRNGETLSHERLQTVTYIEWLVAASDADDLLLERWDRLRRDPLAYCPLPDPRGFREGRGLSQAPRFATVEAGNALADASGRQMSRGHLYAQCLPILAYTLKEREKRLGPAVPPPSSFWSTLAKELHQGNCPDWRGVSGAPQSTLLTEQLLRDALTALLNGWLDVPPPWRYAVLIELGEYRKPGNHYTRANVAKVRVALRAKLGHFRASPRKAGTKLSSDTVRHATQWKSIP